MHAYEKGERAGGMHADPGERCPSDIPEKVHGQGQALPVHLHFDVDLLSERAAYHVVEWLFGATNGRNVEKIAVGYQDVRMDAEPMRILLDCGR